MLAQLELQARSPQRMRHLETQTSERPQWSPAVGGSLSPRPRASHLRSASVADRDSRRSHASDYNALLASLDGESDAMSVVTDRTVADFPGDPDTSCVALCPALARWRAERGETSCWRLTRPHALTRHADPTPHACRTRSSVQPTPERPLPCMRDLRESCERPHDVVPRDLSHSGAATSDAPNA